MNPDAHHRDTEQPAAFAAFVVKRDRSLWKGPALITAVLMVLPMMGHLFVAGWHWHAGSYIVFGALVFGVALIYRAVTRQRASLPYRAAMAVAVVAAFVLTWSNVVQRADVNPNAILYLAVPGVGLIGAAIARLRPAGMARALLATALAQALAWVIVLSALLAREPLWAEWSAPVLRGLFGNFVMCGLFGVSAWLFRKAARQPSPSGDA